MPWFQKLYQSSRILAIESQYGLRWSTKEYGSVLNCKHEEYVYVLVSIRLMLKKYLNKVKLWQPWFFIIILQSSF